MSVIVYNKWTGTSYTVTGFPDKETALDWCRAYDHDDYEIVE